MTSLQVEGQQSDPRMFCLLCNSSVTDVSGSDDRALVLVQPSTDFDGLFTEMEAVHGEDTKHVLGFMDVGKMVMARAQPSNLGNSEWIKKYQGFLSETLHLHLEDFFDEDDSGFKKEARTSAVEEAVLFCTKCKFEVEKLYLASEQVKVSTKAFEDFREKIATSLTQTFVDQKFQYEEPLEDVEMEDLKNSTAAAVLEKWRYIYTGDAERDLKERSLISDIREEAIARSEAQAKTEFPEGTGLSAMELAKMQRMMTACYFTPKMSIVRKRGKLFFSVGVPRNDKDKVYICPVCDESFNHLRSLNVHLRKHKSIYPRRLVHYTCSICGEIYADRKDLIFHKRTHVVGTVDGPVVLKYSRIPEYYTCPICTFKFASKNGRNSHLKKYHQHEKFYKCTVCQELFTSETVLIEHFDAKHRNLATHSSNGNNDHTHLSELFTCVECSKQFLRIKSLVEHRRVHAIDTLTECYYCGMGFEGMESLQDHTNVTHMVPNPFNCDGCEESFATDEALVEHMKSKSQRSSTYICETCGRISHSKEALQKHLLTHGAVALAVDSEGEVDQEEDGQVHQCDLCDQTFPNSMTLEAHTVVQHANKLRFKCEVCGDDEGFKDAKELRKHIIEAHAELVQHAPYHCTVCWNSFATEEDLETHTLEAHKRFKCNMCSKVFKLSEHLKRHVLVHTGEKPFKCTICDKSFNQESNLKEHVYRHQGYRPHRCPQCPDAAFLRRVQLKEHMLAEHGVGLEDIPALPIGRAAQNARRAGTYPSGDAVEHKLEAIKKEETQRFKIIYQTPAQKPVIVNDVTVRDDGLHERFAPLIMKSLQNKSNQPIIVRRGIQTPDKTPYPYAAAIQIKSGGITTSGEIIEADLNADDEASQEYVLYKV